MGKMNAGNWGALLQGGIQGAETEQKMTEQDLRNRYMKDSMVDPAAMANQYDTKNFQQWQQQNGQTPFQSQGMLFDPVRNKLADVYQSAKAKLSSFLPGQGQHAMGPAAQATVPQGSNVAMSRPQPGVSGSSAAPGLPGASGPMPLPESDAQVGQPRPYADGGIPGRKATGLVRQRKAKPGNVAKPTKAAQTAMHSPMEKPPVDNQEMGAEGGPPRNTDAQPGSQDPMLADGGHFIQGAIKHPGALHEQLGVPKGEKIPKGKLDKAAHAKGKLGQRARFAETLRKFDDGGAVGNANHHNPNPSKDYGSPASSSDEDYYNNIRNREGSDAADKYIHDVWNASGYRKSGPINGIPRDVNHTPSMANGGAVDKPKPFKEPPFEKPQPNALEKDVSNDGQRNRLGKTIKRFADGGEPKDKPAPGLEPAESTSGKWPGLIPALGQSVDFYAKNVGAPIEHAYQTAYRKGGDFLESALMGPKSETSAAPAPKPAAPPAQGPAAPTAAPPMQGPPAPYEDDPSVVEHGGPNAGMVTHAPDGTPITPYNPAGLGGAGHGSGGGSPVPGRDAAPSPTPAQGPEQGQAGPPPIDFSQVQMDHQDIPNTSTQEWDKMKQGIIGGLLAHRQAASPAQAAMMADDQVSQFQHQNFMQYMQQGIALDAAGNKQGAMAALKTAYNYMPTGHGMHFGLDPQTGDIVGVGYDEDHGKPVGSPVRLDQQNLNRLMATYSDPKNFAGESLAMQEQKRKNMETAAMIPHIRAQTGLASAQAGEAQQRGAYYEGRNETTLEAATIRAARAGGSRLPVQSQKYYTTNLNGAILDPRDQGEALGVAEILEGRYGNSPQSQGIILGTLKQMYALPPDQRQQFAIQNKIPLPGLTQEAPMDPSMMYGQGYGQGYGVQPR